MGLFARQHSQSVLQLPLSLPAEASSPLEGKEGERVSMWVSCTLPWCQAAARAHFGAQRSASGSKSRGMAVDPSLVYKTL